MDRRIKYTKTVIKDTFLSLLKEKEINKITVSEICKIADINRATFYRYYLDIYDLLNKIEDEFVEEIKSASSSEDEYSVASFSKNLLEVFLENKDLVTILFNTMNNLYFLNDILDLVYQKCKEKWEKDLVNISSESIEYASVFIFNGALGVVNYWVKNGFTKSVDEIANIIEKLSYYGIKKYIYNIK